MGLFSKKETDEQIVKRLAKNAGSMFAMFKAYFNTPRGVDATKALIFTSALAGYACHQAVIAEGGSFVEVTTKDDKKFYFGDDVNKYLLEGSLNVVGFCTAVTGVSLETVKKIVSDFAESVGDENYTICGYNPKSLYEQVESCWDGIYENMTSQYCKSPSEWPVLIAIVVQNILVMSLNAGASKDEAGEIAIKCAVAVSKMGRDSF